MLWIIYTKSHLKVATYSPALMSKAASDNGIENEVFYSEFFSVELCYGEEVLYYKNERVNNLPDVAFFRCYNFMVMEYLTKRGVKLVNSYEGMKKVRDKFETHKVVDKLKISQPVTILSSYPDFELLKEKLTLPFVMKDNSGAGGKGVYLINNEQEMMNVLKENKRVKFIFQKYVSFSKGRDVRLYVVGDRVVGGVIRKATKDDFRSNISLGGVSEKFLPSKELKMSALKVAEALDLKICSVDFLFNDNEFTFCEANGNAAFSAFFAQGYNMQKIFMEYIKSEFFKKN